jgi:hypothetical protein
MNLLSLVENVMVKLGGLPGLQFLSRYVSEYQSRRTRASQTVGRHLSYVQTVRGAASDVKTAARGSKNEEEGDLDEEEVENNYEESYEEDDDESYLQ